jgi:2,4-dienoyl-CoA reductase (NADPH2)
MSFEHVLAPGVIGTLRLPNRIIMGSMHLGIEPDDDPSALCAFYVERARGGVGLIVTGGSSVSKEGAGGRNYGFINEPREEPKLHRVAQAVHDAGGRIALQLFHAGRYAFYSSFGMQPVAPSAVPSRFSPDPPRALSEEGIHATIADFANGAERALRYGFDGVEIMASEGYLLNQFLSPLTNKRDDAWGGDFERRMHLPRAVLRAVREAVGPDFPVIVRMSGADLMEGSTTQEEICAFACALRDDGADAINVGIGWHESPIPTVQQVVPEGVWIRYAAKIKEAVGDFPVIASNRVNSLGMADAIVAEGKVDFISMARPFLADAQIVAKSARGDIAFVNTCIACNQACIDLSLTDDRISCMVNPRAARELDFPEDGAVREHPTRRFAVIGGGPAGMEASRALAALGHSVELFEAAEELGGQFRMARRIPGKHVFGETIRYYTNELPRLGMRMHLGSAIAEEDAPMLREFDGIILASGVVPRAVDIPGSDLPHVISYADALLGNKEVEGDRVAIIGAGGIGVDLAHWLGFGEANVDDATRFLYEQGLANGSPGDVIITGRKTVSLLRRGNVVGERIGRSTRWAVLKALRSSGVAIYTEVSYEAIIPQGVCIRDADGNAQLIDADTVIIAAGQERNTSLIRLLERLRVPYRVVGGAKDATELNAVRAFEEGLRAAHELSRLAEVQIQGSVGPA